MRFFSYYSFFLHDHLTEADLVTIFKQVGIGDERLTVKRAKEEAAEFMVKITHTHTCIHISIIQIHAICNIYRKHACDCIYISRV